MDTGVMLGENVEVFPGAVIGIEPKDAGTTAEGTELKRRVTIGDDCSIGPNSVIFYEVEIGRNSIVAAGSIVIKDVPYRVRVQGVSATVLGEMVR